MSAHWIRIVWPLAMLAIFAATFRRPAVDRATAGDTVDCAQITHAQDAGRLTIADLERCLALDPGDVETMAALAAAYEAAHRAGDAEAQYRRALDVEPHDARAHVALGRLLLAQRDAAGARREADAALRWHPGSGPAARLAAEARAR